MTKNQSYKKKVSVKLVPGQALFVADIEFVWEERKKVQTISFAIKKARVWISIDKKVIRSEML